MNKWQLARYFIDAKKDIDNILFISNNVMKLRNIDLRRIINYKLSEFYINLCVVYDKSLGQQKSQLKKNDEVIKSTYYQRDKNYAHKDDDYNKNDIEYEKLIKTLKTQLEYCFEKCSAYLPEEITIDYVNYDRDLYRFINKLDYDSEEQLKSQIFPQYNKVNGTPLKTLKAFYDTEDIKNVQNNEDYGVMFEAGICLYEGLQNLQDSCIRINVLYNLDIWCSLKQKN